MRRCLVYIPILFAGFLSLCLAGDIVSSSPVKENQNNSFKRSSSAIALTKDGSKLLVVNPDSNSLSIVDLMEFGRALSGDRPEQAALSGNGPGLREVLVGIDPRTVAVNDLGDRAYVANRGSDSISMIDLEAGEVINEVEVGDRPYGVIVSPDGRFLFLAEQGSSRVRILDADSLATIGSTYTGERPSGLAIDGLGQKLYVTHLLSSPIVILDVRYPYGIFLPAVQGLGGGQGTGEETASNRSITVPLWPDSNLVQSIIIDPHEEIAYIPHTRSNTSNRALTFDTTVFPLVSLIDLKTEKHLIGQQYDLGTLDPPGIGLPFDGMVAPNGKELWVLNSASNDITVIDLETRQKRAHIEVGHNPRGLVLTADGSTVFVNNTLEGTVSVIDTKSYSVTDTIEVTSIPLPPLILEGKRLFHSSDDPRLSKDQWIACSTCHFDGEHDGRTWFFGFAGPRNTTSLLGMIQTYPLRWSGEWDESADGEFAIRKENFGSGLVSGDMHCALSPPDCVDQPPNQGREYELDAMAAFMDSLPMPLNPAHANGEPLSAAAQRGRKLFADPELRCLECHPPPYYTDQQAHDVGTVTADEKIGPAYDTPGLRSLYNSAPYFHDGSAATLYDALTRPTPNGEHDVREILSEGEIQDLIAYLEALPFTK